MNYKGKKRYIAGVLIAIFILVNVVPTKEIADYAKYKDVLDVYSEVFRTENREIPYEEAKNQSQVGDEVDGLTVAIEKVSDSMQAQNYQTVQKDINTLREQLGTVKIALKDEEKKNVSKLQELNSQEAIERQQEYTKTYEDKLNEFDSKLETFVASLDSKEVTGEIKSVWNTLKDSIQTEQPQSRLIVDNLPHSETKALQSEPQTGDGITPAYAKAAGTTIGEDLSETKETPFSSEIIALGNELKEPQKIYEYVRNNILYEPYLGSRKGAVGTINEKTGNDIDQASLMIALLRQQGYSARYVEGTVEISIDKLMNWTATDTKEAAVQTIASMGIPTKSLVSGGEIVGAQIQHTWVEVYLHYENYRGEKGSTGEQIWVPLDPSFKQYKLNDGLDIKAISGLSQGELKAGLEGNAEKSQDGTTITNVNNEKLQGNIDDTMKKVETYIKDNGLEGQSVNSLIGGKEIIPEQLSLLPNSLPYKTVGVYKEYTQITDEQSEKIGFSIGGEDAFSLNFGNEKSFYKEYSAVELYGKRIVLEWVAATSEDKRIIDSYGGIMKVPSYLVRVKPQLKIDGEVAAEGQSVHLGYRQQFTITMKHVGLQAQEIDNPLTIGGVYAVALDYGNISATELDNLKTDISQLKENLTEANMYTDNGMGQIVNSVAKTYFAQLDIYNQIIGTATNVNSYRFVSEAMAGYSPKVKYMFNMPVQMGDGSFFIDVDHDMVAVTSKNMQKSDEIMYMMQAGMLGSSMESTIFEQILGLPSVSTIKILEEANKRGVPIYTFSKENINRIGELTVSQSVRTDIINAVNK